MNRVLLTFGLLLIMWSQICAQKPQGQKLEVISPNAESFKIYEDIPVSMYTGIPQIRIPLHTIQTPYTDINISLNYHSSGFKADMHPSWVGLGWNLDVGGVISREIKYIPDENNSLSFVSSCNDNPDAGIGFYYSYRILDKTKWYIPDDPLAINSDFKARNIDIDKQPDIFSFNFMGYSGKFYINHKGKWIVQCDVPMKVECNTSDIKGETGFPTPHFTKFTLIDGKGTKYIFGGENAVEFTASMMPCNYDYDRAWQAKSWYLKEIVPPVGESITFTYERGPYQSSFHCVYPQKITYRNSGSRDEAHSYVLSDVSGSLISTVYLRSILIPSEELQILFETSKSNDLNYFETNYKDFFYYSPDGIVPAPFLGFNATNNIPHFERNPEDRKKATTSYRDRFLWLKLNEIRLEYLSTTPKTIAKKILLEYEENTKTRLKLNTVTMQYQNSLDKEIYKFEYNQSLLYEMSKEPEYLSEYGDHWGYSNMKYLWMESDKNNDPKGILSERAKLGVLSKIIYPTKGYTELFFENHDYQLYISNDAFSSIPTYIGTDKLASGLRIRRIINVDGQGLFSSKEYFYRDKNKNISSGILHELPGIYKDNGFLFDNSGAHITYSSVLEKNTDGSFKNVDFIHESYISRLGENVLGCTDDPPLYVNSWVGPVTFCERDLERGKISDEYYCDSVGKVYKSVHYTYQNIGKDSSNFVRTVDSQYTPTFYPGTGRTGQTAHYYYCYYNKLISTRVISYDKVSNISYLSSIKPGNYQIINVQNNEYDNYGQIKKIITLTSTNKQQTTEIKYPYSTNPISNIHQEMIKRNMISYPVKEDVYLDRLYKGGAKYNYSFFNNNTQILLSSSEQNFRDNLNPLISSYKYNSIGKLIEINQSTGDVETFLWDYLGRKLKASIKNANVQTVKEKLSDNIFDCTVKVTNWEEKLSLLRRELTTAHIFSYEFTYNNLLHSQATPTGTNNYYKYDDNSRLESILDNNKKAILQYSYQYRQSAIPSSVYFNKVLVTSAARTCPEGYVSDKEVSLNIPSRITYSLISQNDANNKAYQLYYPKVKELAENTCRCIIDGKFQVENTEYTNIISSHAYCRGDEMTVSYVRLTWTNKVELNQDFLWFYYGGLPIGKLKGNTTLFPKKVTYREFSDDRMNKTNDGPNMWVVWIDTSGFIRIKLRDPDKGRVPDSIDFQVKEFSVPIK